MITKEQLIKIYSDAHLVLKEDNIDDLVTKFSNLIDFNSVLLEIEGEEIKEINTENTMTFREDEPKEGMDREEALSYASDREYGYFRLKRVLD